MERNWNDLTQDVINKLKSGERYDLLLEDGKTILNATVMLDKYFSKELKTYIPCDVCKIRKVE